MLPVASIAPGRLPLSDAGRLRSLHDVFGEPNDWSRTRRMLQIGVYIGMVDEVVVDKYESKSSPANYGFVEDEAAS